MNKINHHINIILVCSNTIGLTTYCYYHTQPYSSYTFFFPFFLSILKLPIKPSIVRILYCLVSLMALLTVFLPYPNLALFIAGTSLGLAINLGYELTNQIQHYQNQLAVRLYEGSINLSIALGIIIAKAAQFFQFTDISAKLFVLTTTLANLYLPLIIESGYHGRYDTIRNKVSFALVPFYMETWTYAIGYAIGIYLNTFEILSTSKHGKYLVVALLLLIETLTYKSQIKMISQLLRAVLIYHFEKNTNTIEMLFVVVFLILRLLFMENQLNLYLMVGYLVITLTLWRSEYRDSNSDDFIRQSDEDNAQELRLLESSVSNVEVSSPSPVRLGKNKVPTRLFD